MHLRVILTINDSSRLGRLLRECSWHSCLFLWPSSEGADHEGSELHEQLHSSARHHPEDSPGVSYKPVALHSPWLSECASHSLQCWWLSRTQFMAKESWQRSKASFWECWTPSTMSRWSSLVFNEETHVARLKLPQTCYYLKYLSSIVCNTIYNQIFQCSRD